MAIDCEPAAFSAKHLHARISGQARDATGVIPVSDPERIVQAAGAHKATEAGQSRDGEGGSFIFG